MPRLLHCPLRPFMSVFFILCGFFSSSLNAANGAPFPDRPIRVIVASSAGTGADIFARIIGQELTAQYHQQVVVENRTGAGGLIGGVVAANATADGYTLFMASTSTYVAPLLQAKPSYRPIEDFAAVAQVAAITSVVLTPMSLPVKSVKELIEWTKARPATMNFGSVGAGTAGHLSAEIFNRATGITPVHVPFKGFSDLLTDLISARIQLMVFVMPSVLPMIKEGKLRALAVTSPNRSFALPDIPSLAELGWPDAQSETLYGFLAPVKTPTPLIHQVSTDIVNILKKPDTLTRFEKLGAQPTSQTSAPAFELYVRQQYQFFRQLMPAIGLHPQ